jgi:tRNA pseudouridine55 synthase
MDGIINVLKPPGMSSHDVVKHIRHWTKEKKVGHTGTLDPGAAGVLPICLGGATKLSSMLTGADKQYIAEMTLGIETDSLDGLGQVVGRESIPEQLDKQIIEQGFSHFIGEIVQIPPMTSAIKINGQKLYELARKGKIIERKSRRVTIKQLQLLTYGMREDRLAGTSLPYIRFRVDCSKGTYIRTLCSDLGRFWNSCAYMSFLVRTKAGNFNIENSHSLEEIKQSIEEGKIEQVLIPVDKAFASLPEVIVIDQAIPLIMEGNWVFSPDLNDPDLLTSGQLQDEVRLYTKARQFLGIYKYESDWNNLKKQPRVRKYGYNSALRPVKVFAKGVVSDEDY